MSIILNVSGRIFKVSCDVICKSELFNGMLTDCNIDGEIMIDRSSKLFEHVYSYLLDDKYPYPKKYYSELDYYLVSYDIDLLYDPHKKCAEESRRINEEMSNMKNMMYIALDKIIELLSTDSDRKCRYFECDDGCVTYLLTCDQHRDKCCYSEEDKNGYRKFCKNGTHGTIIYCDKHIFNYRYTVW